MKSKIFLFGILFLITLNALSSSFEVNPNRRRNQFATDAGHFFYPMVADVPGMGTSYGVGGTAVNIFKTDIDVTGFYLKGDFDAIGTAVLNYHLVPKFLILDGAYYKFRAATQVFERGIDSNKDEYISPETEGDAKVGQATITLFQRKFEIYTRIASSDYRVNKVISSTGEKFENLDREEKTFLRYAYGAKIDLTDDKVDPRNGLRIESEMTGTNASEEDVSSYNKLDTNMTTYLPVGASSTLSFNIYNSRSIIKKRASTDETYLRSKIGLSCEKILDARLNAQCLDAENKLINDRIAKNEYGEASSLGGTQRLRSFPNGRFIAGNALFFGSEFRLNLTDEKTFMDYYILKGVRTNIQLAFFAETGTVVERANNYFKNNWKHSYGAGVRLCFSGVVLRFDGGIGNEGFQAQMFLDYPWNLYAIDSGI